MKTLRHSVPILSALTILVLTLAPANAELRLRGFRGDMTDKNDRYVPLDLTGDKRTDILYYRPGSGLAGAYISHGDGSFRYVPYSESGQQFNGFPGDVMSADDVAVPLDINGDGKMDFLWIRPGSGYALICISRGDGRLSCTAFSTPDGQFKGFTGNVLDKRDTAVPLDINGDGRSDFLWLRPGAGYAIVYVSNADGTVTPVVYSNAGALANGFADTMMNGKERALPLDLNGDGKSDFIVYTPGGQSARAYISRGDGTVQSLIYTQGLQRGSGFTYDLADTRDVMVALDLNGDRKSDILIYRPGAGFAFAYLSNGDGSVRVVEYSTPGSQRNGFAGDVMSESDRAVPLDLNGDGKDDFLWYRPGTGYAGVHLSKGDGTLVYRNFSTPDGQNNNFSGDVKSTTDTAAPANLTGQRGSGFLWFRRGGGNGSFQAYEVETPGTELTASLRLFSYYGSTETWMGDYSYVIGQTPLSKIAIPGTHDSAMYPGMPDGDLAKNQRMDFYNQMKAGARFFDFRFAHISPTAPTRLGVFPTGQAAKAITGSYVFSAPDGLIMYGHSDLIAEITVADALGQIRKFLDEHPTEIAVLSTNPSLSGSVGDWTNDAALTFKTALGDLIFDKTTACALAGNTYDLAAAKCSGSMVTPGEVTLATLLAKGKRIILLDENGSKLTSTQYFWFRGDVGAYAGYLYDPGIANIDDQIAYMTDGLVANRRTTSPSKLLQLNGALTPFGRPPCYNMCGFGPIPLSRAFNPELAKTLRSSTWKRFAINFVSVDNIGESDIAEAIIEFNDQRWVEQEQTASQVGVGADGSVWIIDPKDDIYRRMNDTWTKVNGAAKQIAVDPKGLAWVVNSIGQIYRYNGSSFERMPGSASDIAIGADGSVWILGAEPITSEGFPISKWTGIAWSQLPGDASAVQIAVDASGNPWVVNKSGLLFRYTTSTQQWETIAIPNRTEDVGLSVVNVFTFPATNIQIGADGSIWLIAAGLPWQYNGVSWDPLRVSATRMAAGADGIAWVIGPRSELYVGQVY